MNVPCHAHPMICFSQPAGQSAGEACLCHTEMPRNRLLRSLTSDPGILRRPLMPIERPAEGACMALTSPQNTSARGGHNTKRISRPSLRACSTKGRSRSLRYHSDFAAPFIVRRFCALSFRKNPDGEPIGFRDLVLSSQQRLPRPRHWWRSKLQTAPRQSF